jgi:hypothetical protein
VPNACTLSSFSVVADTNTYVSRTFTVLKGASSTTMTNTLITCVPSGFTGCSSAQTAGLQAGQYFTVADTHVAAPTQPNVNFFFRITCQ